jgi:hypothetical protein
MTERKIQDDYPETGKVIPGQLNMRATPAGAIIKVLTKDSTLTILRGRDVLPWTIGKDPSSGNQHAIYWLKVQVGEVVGYVMKHWIDFAPAERASIEPQ